MYQSTMFKEARLGVLHDLINNFPFANVVVTHADGVEVAHLPLILDPSKQKLIGHVAIANPLFKILSDAPQAVIVIFNGEHGYISPSYYLEPEQHVPTWNYVVVQVRGEISLITDETQLMSILDQLQAQYDVTTTDWSNFKMKAQLKGIGGFEIAIAELNGKFKLSQNRTKDNQQHIIQKLAESKLVNDMQLAEFMQSYFEFK